MSNIVFILKQSKVRYVKRKATTYIRIKSIYFEVPVSPVDF